MCCSLEIFDEKGLQGLFTGLLLVGPLVSLQV